MPSLPFGFQLTKKGPLKVLKTAKKCVPKQGDVTNQIRTCRIASRNPKETSNGSATRGILKKIAEPFPARRIHRGREVMALPPGEAVDGGLVRAAHDPQHLTAVSVLCSHSHKKKKKRKKTSIGYPQQP